MVLRLGILFILLMMGAQISKVYAEPRIIDIRIMAKSKVEVYDKTNKKYQRVDLQPPIFEYLEMRRWHQEDANWEPTFDAIAVILNPDNSAAQKIQVHFQVLAKVGSVIAEKEFEVIDYAASVKTAVWLNPEFENKTQVESLLPNEARSVTWSDINLHDIMEKYLRTNRWPFFIKVRAWLVCASCPPDRQVEKEFEVIPND